MSRAHPSPKDSRRAHVARPWRRTLWAAGGVALTLVAGFAGWAWQASRSHSPIREVAPVQSSQDAPESAIAVSLLADATTLDGRPVTARGNGWEAVGTDRLGRELPNAILAVRYDAADVAGFEGEVRVLSVSTGEELGRVRTSWGVMAVVRDSAQELLVADVLPTPAADQRYRLLVLDATRGLSIKRQLQLEWRVEYKIYAPKIRLSPDQRLLYYLTYTAPESSWGLRVLDLENLDASPAYARLPGGCGFAYFDVTAAGALVACRDGHLLVVSPTGTVRSRGHVLSADAERDPRGELFPWAGLRAAFLRDDGTVVAVAASGEIAEVDTADVVHPRGGALAGGLEVSMEGVSRMGTTATIGFWERSGSRNGIAVVDLETVTVVNTITTQNSWAFALRLPRMTVYQQGLRVVTVADDGQVRAFNMPGQSSSETGWALAR